MTISAPGQIAALLAPALEQVERGFLVAGESLEHAIAILDRLNARFAAQVSEMTDDGLEVRGEQLAAAGQQVTRLAVAHETDAATLTRLAAIVVAIRQRTGMLDALTREIDVLALSARVVAAGMGQAGSEFLHFTTSIRNAVQRARICLSQVGTDLHRVNAELRSAHDDADAFVNRQGQAIQAIPRGLQEHAATLSMRRKLARDASAAAQGRAEGISRKISEQIAALQLGDITRQRLEHVRTGLALLEERSGTAPRVVRILAAQLQDSAAVLAKRGEGIESGLIQLAADAIAIDQLGLDMQSGATDRPDSFVTMLRTDLHRTTASFVALRAADSDAERRVRAVLDATGDLVGQLAGLQLLEQDIHIIGLNATLKCSRLGPAGRPLAAVAQELRACGHRFADETASVLAELGRLRQQAGGLLDPDRQRQHAALAETADVMLQAAEQLHRLEQELHQGMAQLRADAEQVGQLVAGALEQFSVRESVVALMRQAAQQLDTLSATDASDDTDLLALIAGTYTMACEREVHARLAPLPEAGGWSADESAADDVLF